MTTAVKSLFALTVRSGLLLASCVVGTVATSVRLSLCCTLRMHSVTSENQINVTMTIKPGTGAKLSAGGSRWRRRRLSAASSFSLSCRAARLPYGRIVPCRAVRPFVVLRPLYFRSV